MPSDPEKLTSVLGQDQGLSVPMPPTFDDVAQERAYRKRELVIACRIFGRFGFSEGVAGHITCRDPGEPDKFWVNPFGVHFSHVGVRDLLLVDHSGTIVEGTRPVNKAAFAIHSHVHEARPDVIAAAHSHSTYGRAFAALHLPLEPLTQDATAFYQDHGLYAEYGGVADDHLEGERIAKVLGTYKAAILANHGLLTVGQSVREAIWWFVTMERSCQVQLLAMAAGTPRPISHETALDVGKGLGRPLAGWIQAGPMWDEAELANPDIDN